MKYRFPAFLLILAIVAGLFWRAWHTKKPSSEPDLAPLRQQLEMAAEKALPLPTLGGWSILINVPAAQMEPRVAALTDLAKKCGGNAQRVLDREQSAVILAQIPAANYAIFAENARLWPMPAVPPMNSTTSELLDGEVILFPASASR